LDNLSSKGRVVFSSEESNITVCKRSWLIKSKVGWVELDSTHI
jgi:hypothetical protein